MHHCPITDLDRIEEIAALAAMAAGRAALGLSDLGFATSLRASNTDRIAKCLPVTCSKRLIGHELSKFSRLRFCSVMKQNRDHDGLD